MTKRTILLLGSIALFGYSCWGTVKIGNPAPEFEGTDANGDVVTLSDFRGKYVVLEWLNHGCPFVKKQYHSGNMQQLQQTLTSEGAVWLSVISSAKGKQGYSSPLKAREKADEVDSHATHIILDASGQIGRLYDARCTPEMFILAPDGSLIYQGAVDSISSVRESDLGRAENYVLNAWNAHRNGETVDPSSTPPYGCAVKY